MSIQLRTNRPDRILKQIADALEQYQKLHRRARIEAYRHNSVSVRIRVLDPEFKGRSRVDREEEVWAALDQLREDTIAEISLLLLLTPEEAKSSIANADFEDPIPSRL